MLFDYHNLPDHTPVTSDESKINRLSDYPGGNARLNIKYLFTQYIHIIFINCDKIRLVLTWPVCFSPRAVVSSVDKVAHGRPRFPPACFSCCAADAGFSPPLCFVEMPPTALPMAVRKHPDSVRFRPLHFTALRVSRRPAPACPCSVSFRSAI